MVVNRLYAAALTAALVLTGCTQAPVQPPADPGPITLFGNKTTFEIAPVLVAAQDFYPGNATVKMGGIANLVGEPPIAGFGEEGAADIATHAETQALRYSVKHPDLRIILNVSRGLYRIVARRSAGIATVADLKGKKIATIPPTSAGYFLYRMLEREGLSYADIRTVSMPSLSAMTTALKDRKVDAVVIWEPESENSARVLGDDLIEFDGTGVYSEYFNLNSTAERLADPAVRARTVAFVRATIDAAARIRKDPTEAKALVTRTAGFTPEEVEQSWKHHAFAANYPDDMLDVLVAEEQWLADQDKRTPRSREELAKLVDRSVYEEALTLTPGH